MSDLPDDAQLIGEADRIEVVWWETPSGQVQPVIWPMVLHRHTQDCMRA